MSLPHPSPASPRFADLGVPQALSASLEARGITTAFPIQAAALPDCLAGRDVCGRAATGAGKTLAFGLGVLSRLAAREVVSRRGRTHPSVLILVPTRELAAQIEEALTPLATAIGVRLTSVYGGVAYGKQTAALRKGVEVVIACPGRLTDLVDRGLVRLSWVDMVVVDEADRMADMGFLPAVRRLIDLTSATRQTLLFSATLEGPVDRLIRDYQHDPILHDVKASEADRGEVSHLFWHVEPNERVEVTAAVVSQRGPAMVFCRTKQGADRLAARLGRSGLSSTAIHGDRSQSQRERALAEFRAGRCEVLVATDVVARGIHVEAVPLVVHFDPPSDATDYIHRSGRTGRAGAHGSVVSLVGSHQLASSKKMRRELGLLCEVLPPGVRAKAPDSVAGESRDPRAATDTASRIRPRYPKRAARKRSGASTPGAKSTTPANAGPSQRPTGSAGANGDRPIRKKRSRVSSSEPKNRRRATRPPSRARRSQRSSRQTEQTS
jgi:superfamily II DNA/RNA helicase